MKKVKWLLLSERGDMIEYLIRIVIIGLGGAAILFGVLEVLRLKGAELIERINGMDI